MSNSSEVHCSVFFLAPTIFTYLVAGAFFFGYRFEIAYGNSMEPALSDGDMIWVKYLDVADATD